MFHQVLPSPATHRSPPSKGFKHLFRYEALFMTLSDKSETRRGIFSALKLDSLKFIALQRISSQICLQM